MSAELARAVGASDFPLDAYKRHLVHPVLHGEGTDTLVRNGRTVLTNANQEYVVLSSDTANPRYLHVLSITVSNPAASITAYVQLTSKPSGAGTTIEDCFCPPKSTRHFLYGFNGLRPTNNEHFGAKSDVAGVIVRADGYSFDE
jgi:hypothetical protein